MSASVLGHLTLGYQWVWQRQRRVAAVQLFVLSDTQAPVDARHLLDVLAQTWTGDSARLILSVQSTPLLADLLQHAPADGPWLVVQASQLALQDDLTAQVQAAARRQVPMLWRGEPGERLAADMQACFLRSMMAMTAGEALLALHEARHATGGSASTQASRRNKPIMEDQIYEGIGSLALAEHCLDHAGAWGVAGWPIEDVLHGYRERAIEPAKPDLLRLIGAVDRDLSIDRIEHLLACEPLLAYRFLRFANSARFGLRSDIESLRHGLMIHGLSTLRHWLMDQLTSASEDGNLQPARQAMVLRSQLMEQLLDAGDQDSLRREVVLCGLLSQIDLLAGEPLGSAMQRIPVSQRVLGAVLSNSGPYAAYLQIATALEYPAMHAIPELCASNDIDIADVNRTLLRVLSQARTT